MMIIESQHNKGWLTFVVPFVDGVREVAVLVDQENGFAVTLTSPGDSGRLIGRCACCNLRILRTIRGKVTVQALKSHREVIPACLHQQITWVDEEDDRYQGPPL